MPIEGLVPLWIIHKRFRHGWVLSMVGLHLLTWATMDILFWENLAVYPVLLVDNEYMLNKFDRLRDRLANSIGRANQAEDEAVDVVRAYVP